MTSPPTELDGAGSRFQTTLWTDIAAAADPSSPGCRQSLERLCQAYWKPVFAFIRRSGGRSVQDAEDLAQGFFVGLLTKGAWARLCPERGSFRAYLKRALRNYLSNARRDEFRDRAGHRVFQLDLSAPGLGSDLRSERAEDPEAAFDRAWVAAVMEAALRDLEAFLAREGKAAYLEILRAYCFQPGAEAEPGYAEVAGRLDLKVHDVRNRLAYCRRLLRQFLRERIRDYVATEGEVERELGEILGT